MKDTIIKGTGNSRTLKTVPNALTLYSDFSAMMQAMIDGTFPIDIGPLNPAGVDTMGTALSKENLLKDATAALYGKSADVVTDDIFVAIRSLITTTQNNLPKIAEGTYYGTDGIAVNLNFGFTPKLFLCRMNGKQTGGNNIESSVGLGFSNTITDFYTWGDSGNAAGSSSAGNMTGTTITITDYYLLIRNMRYFYIAIG